MAAVDAPRRARAVATCLLVAIGLGLYARTPGYEFLDWDDAEQVVNNPWIRSLSIEHLVAMFSQPVVGSYFPLQSLSFMLDHALWGLDPRGYHAQSVLLNALNGVLAFWVLARLARSNAVAFMAALLWSVHHTHVEAVAWVSARKELLSSALLLLSLGTYLRARDSGALDRRLYAGSVALFGLATAAKITVGSYALFFLLVDRIEDSRVAPELRRSLRQHLWNKLPYLAAALPFVAMNLWVQPASTLGASTGFDYVLVRGQAAWRYLWLLLGVLSGQPLYDPPPISHDPRLVAAILLPLVTPPAAFVFALRKGWTNAAYGLAWVVIGLLAPLAFPLVTYMADRYLYLPALGFCWVIAAAIAKLAFTARSRALSVILALTLIAPPAAWFARLSWIYTPTWRNSESLWTRAVATTRIDDRPATALSKVFLQQRRWAEAEHVLSAAPALSPIGHLHLAVAYFELKRFEDSWRASDDAIAAARERPLQRGDAARLMHLRGVLLIKQHRLEEAVAALKTALVLDPGHVPAREALDAIERGSWEGAAADPGKSDAPADAAHGTNPE